MRAQTDRDKRTDTNAQKEKQAAERKEFEKKTLAFLNDVASGAWGLKLPENRLFVLTQAADLMWPFDEKRARTVYWDAVNTLNLLTASARSTDNKKLSDSQAAMAAVASGNTDSFRELLNKEISSEKKRSNLVAYAVIDPPKAFALAERTVDSANRQISLLLLLDKIVKSGSVKKNEIVLEQSRLLPLDYLVFKYGKGMSALAKADFNRTRALAERFERNELRLMAQLLMLKGMLEPESSGYAGTIIEVVPM